MNHNLPEDAIEVARIAGAWGIKGSIRVIPYSAEADALLHAKRWYLLSPEKSVAFPQSKEGTFPAQLNVEKIQDLGKNIRVDVAEVSDRNQAEALKGARIFISRADFPEPESNEFYWVDLIGLHVFNLQGDQLGVVDNLISNGPQSILRVMYNAEQQQRERLIPFVDAYIVDVDLEKQTIQVDWQLDY